MRNRTFWGAAASLVALGATSWVASPAAAQATQPSPPPAEAPLPPPDIRELTAQEKERATTLFRSLSLYRAGGGHANALDEVLPELLALAEQTYGTDHPETLWLRLIKAGSLAATLEHEAAEQLYLPTIEALKRRLGPQASMAVSGSIDRAANFVEWGRLAQAEALLPPLAPVVERIAGTGTLEHARVLANLAFLRVHQGRYSEGEQLARQALTIREAKLKPDDALIASTRARIATALIGAGKYQEAEALLATALPGEPPSNIGGARLIQARGELRTAQGRYFDAEKDLAKAGLLFVEHAGFNAPESAIASAQSRLAASHVRALPGGGWMGDSGLSVFLLDKGCDSVLPHMAAWWEMRLRGASETRQIDAVNCRRAALSFAEQNLGPDHPLTAATLHELAETLQRTGQTEQAATALRRALAIRLERSGSDHPETARTAALFSEVMGALGRGDEAEALAIRAGGAAQTAQARIRQTLQQASLLEGTGRFEEAASLWNEMNTDLKGAEQDLPLLMQAVVGHAFNSLMTGGCSTLQHDQIAATAEQWKKLYPIFYQLDRRAWIEETLAISEICQGKWDSAARRYAELADGETGRLGPARRFSRDTALLETRRALALLRHPSTLDAAVNAAHEAAGVARQRRFAKEINGNRVGGALALPEGGGQDPLAAAFVVQLQTAWAEELKESRSGPPVRARRPTPEERLAAIRAGKEDPGPGEPLDSSRLINAWRVVGPGYEAFRSAQDLGISAAAQSLLQAAARTRITDPALEALVRRQQALAENLSERERAIFGSLEKIDPTQLQGLEASKAELERVSAEIQKLDPAYVELVRPGALALPDVSRRLKPGEALLYIQPAWNDVYVFVVGPNLFKWHKVSIDAAALDEMVRQLRCQLDGASCQPGEDSNGAFDLALAHELYREVVKPVEGALVGAKELFVVASGGLGGLPLGLLPTAPVSGRGLEGMRQAEWLADRYAMTTLPSVSSLRAFEQAARPAYDAELTGYGNPVLGPPQEPAPARATRRTGTRFADVASIKAMPSLPGTERELLALAAGLGVSRDALRLAGRATESAVKQDTLLGRSRVVVFATHGVLPGGQAGFQEPGLIFTPPGSASAQDDGLLTASEAANLTLPADWLILSACNTAASDGRPNGEALSGLARSFLYAGARSLLASHWQVSDDATAALTVEALRLARAHPELSRAQAMQAAMRAVRTGKTAEGTALAGWKPEWVDPWFWAPFVLIESGS